MIPFIRLLLHPILFSGWNTTYFLIFVFFGTCSGQICGTSWSISKQFRKILWHNDTFHLAAMESNSVQYLSRHTNESLESMFFKTCSGTSCPNQKIKQKCSMVPTYLSQNGVSCLLAEGKKTPFDFGTVWPEATILDSKMVSDTDFGSLEVTSVPQIPILQGIWRYFPHT